MQHGIRAAAVTLMFAANLQAQAPASTKASAQETKHLTIATTASAATVRAGGTVSLLVDVTPKPTMHVYAPEQKGFIPVSLKLDANPALKAAAPKFPKPEPFKAVDETQSVYTKPFRIVQDVTVPAGGVSGPLTLKGTLRYQACDDKICYLPVSVPVAWTVQVASEKR